MRSVTRSSHLGVSLFAENSSMKVVGRPAPSGSLRAPFHSRKARSFEMVRGGVRGTLEAGLWLSYARLFFTGSSVQSSLC